MNKLNLFLLLTFAILFTSCDLNKKKIGEKTARNVLVYLVGGNNLQEALFSDVNDMELEWNDAYDGRLFVMYNSKTSTDLYLIKHDNDVEKINSEILVTYPSDFEPCKKGALTDVMNYIQNNYPADQQALIISSHGSGWIPDTYSAQQKVLDKHTKLLIPTTQTNVGQQRTIGTTDKSPYEIELYDLAQMLDPFDKLEFVLYDACLMASIEGLYQLRNNTKYIISSSAEVLSGGFPYIEMMPHMFAEKTPDVVQMAEVYFDFYNKQTQQVLRSATISVVKTDQLEILANTVKLIIPPYTTNFKTYGVQQFGRSVYYNNFYDLEDFMSKNFNSSPSFGGLQVALEKAVVYKATTQWMFKGENGFEVKTHCGITTYAPRGGSIKYRLDIYNNKYSWGKDSGLSTLFAY